MRFLRLVLSMGCFCMLLLALAILEVAPASSQGLDIAPGAPQHADVFQVTVTPTVSIGDPASTFQITLAELGYEEQVLDSPYDNTEYTLRLPEGWELGEGSVIELDFSYTYNRIGITETQTLPSLFGDIIVVVDDQTQLVFPIREATLEHSNLRVDLPLSLLNDPARNVHSIEVTLDASPICEIPHKAHLIIHPTSLFSLVYNQLPVTADLALYPRPFYQRAFFESDQVRFVLPAQPTEAELAGAVAVAAKLGDLTYGMVLSGTTDLELMDRLEAGEASHEHLIVIGRPESNEVILKLNQLGVLPVPLQERQLGLAGEGTAVVAPGDILTYTLTLANTTQDTVSSLSLSDALPAHTHLVACSPPCTEGVEGGEVSWSVPSLEAGEAFSYTLGLRLSETITDSVIENTITLLDAASGPLNVNTLTTTVSSTPLPESGLRSSASNESRYLLVVGGRAVPEHDGIVEEIVSPWDQTRAILVITGLSDEAVYKASQAMSFESHFPGMSGPFALVREVRPLPESSSELQATDLSFADLGYGDRVRWGGSQRVSYYFDIPLGWRLTEAAYLDLRFRHSQHISYEGSSLTVFFNSQPIATIGFSDETSLDGKLRVNLPASMARSGRSNRIEIQIGMQPFEECADVGMWSMISSESLLHLDHSTQDDYALDLKYYPIPFNQQRDLSDVLFVLPAVPQPNEWENALQLAAALGDAAGGSKLVPAMALGEVWPETELGSYHLLAIGRPSRNPVTQQVNAQLPQPFLPDSDQIEQRLHEVIFRLPPDVSLGYVQLIPSPWNESRSLLAVTGTSDEGVTWATRSLVSSNLLSQLEGDLALIRDQEVQALDTRKLTRSGLGAALSTAVPELTAMVTVTPTGPPAGLATATPMPQTSGEARPSWLIPLVVATALAVAIVFAVAIWQALRRRKV